MSLLDDVRSEVRGSGGICSVKPWLETLSDDERAEVEAAFDSVYTTAAVTRAVMKRWKGLSESALGRHRNKRCQCHKEA